MLNIKHFYWKIFFSAYWLAFDLGEKKTPESNATGFVEITSILNIFGIIFIVNFLDGGNLPYIKLYIALSVFFSFSFNKLIIYSKKLGYKKHLKSFEYLSKPDFNKTRNKTVFCILIFTVLFMILSMTTINPIVRSFLIKFLYS